MTNRVYEISEKRGRTSTKYGAEKPRKMVMISAFKLHASKEAELQGNIIILVLICSPSHLLPCVISSIVYVCKRVP